MSVLEILTNLSKNNTDTHVNPCTAIATYINNGADFDSAVE
jgi:hypothetical protein